MRAVKSRGPDLPTLGSSLQTMNCRRRRLSSPDSGESAYKPLNHCAGKAGSLRLNLWFLTRVLSTLHTRPRVQPASGLPCALSLKRDDERNITRAIRVARTRALGSMP